MKRIEIPNFAEKAELFAFLKRNKNALIQERKMFPKEADGLAFVGISSGVGKAVMLDNPSKDILNVKAAINSTNLLDSHLDVHIPGLWDKTLKENRMMMHVQEHNMTFEKIIADGKDLRASVQNLPWKALGFDYPGVSQVLLFDSDVRKSRNPYMFEQYAKGYVKNHSVFMQYVRLIMCINDDGTDYGAEYEAWQKYYPEVVNKDFADEMGYMWAVLEAKIIEGSAVPKGSNIATPTLSISEKSNAAISTLDLGPSKGTPKLKLNLSYPEKVLKFDGLNVNINKL